jgi:hypothetical protein
MRKLVTIGFLWGLISSVCIAAPPRIDSSSDTAFAKSFSKVTRSLHGYEPRRFALALFGVLLPRRCLTPDATVHLTFAPVAPSDGALLQSCREHLDGKSYADIITEGEAKESAP